MEWKTTLKFNPKQSEELVRAYIMANKEMFGIAENDTVTRITFGTQSECHGYGYNESYSTVFGGIVIEITRKTDDPY